MKKNGFTLIEILFGVTMFITVILFSGNIFTVSNRLSKSNSNLAELVQNSRVAIDKLSRETRQAAELISDISSTSPSHEIFFQDGHDLSSITYIKYYINDHNLLRDNTAYYFAADPNVYVYHDAVDAFSNPPLATTTTQIIGEYFDSLDILNENGLLNLDLNLSKGSTRYNVNTDVYIRNW